MSTRITGRNFSIMFGPLLINADKVSATIEDSTTAAMDRGVPNGVLPGEKKCTGEAELDAKNLDLLTVVAKAAGSWSGMPPVDIVGAAVGDLEGKIVVMYGCKLKLSDILNADTTSSEKELTKVAFEVTDKNFVDINGVPYLSSDDTFGLW